MGDGRGWRRVDCRKRQLDPTFQPQPWISRKDPFDLGEKNSECCRAKPPSQSQCQRTQIRGGRSKLRSTVLSTEIGNRHSHAHWQSEATTKSGQGQHRVTRPRSSPDFCEEQTRRQN
ncbi:hypothetical protein BP00DRAFT_121686 [Aspergillus indologenus CBS 114.80]|uniref:Uncharacterized protein n=1 Tax=Aspergillus indologenus CBS 114.80 TaxID=1450541 RepID=A0A2V5I9K8_9EURO|nr:hypothetical protein BP00DRAFT_121686 [Aspergillus indologenus CBS 114.80]